jgi:hypothetical protein
LALQQTIEALNLLLFTQLERVLAGLLAATTATIALLTRRSWPLDKRFVSLGVKGVAFAP